MAAALSSTATVNPLITPRITFHFHASSVHRRRTFRCSASPPQHKKQAAVDDATPPLLKLAVSGLTQLLSFIPKNNKKTKASKEHAVVVVTSASSADDVLQLLRADYQQAYFLTGNFTPELYAEDCLFEDPTIKFRGKDQYSQNLDLLVPFFDCPSLELEKIDKGRNYDIDFVLAKWKLRTYLKFPWRPLISISGTTTYDLDEEFKIIRHAESWNVSALEAVGQIFTSGFRNGD